MNNNLVFVMEELFGMIDSSFKYILLGFNFLTILAVYFHKRGRKTTKQHHVLFITAHPDDQVMFFGPSISSLVGDYFVHLLCLSRGSANRYEEFKQAATYLGIYKFACVANQKLIDGMKQKWCQETILSIVKQYVLENNIKAIFTFDQQGVSGHINHKAIYNALSACQKQEKREQKLKIKQGQEGEQSKEDQPKQPKLIKIYYLQSTNLLRKYSGLLQLFIAILKDFSWTRINYFSAWRGMQIHKSQFTWYRKLWVVFSRYSYINTFRLRRVSLQ